MPRKEPENPNTEMQAKFSSGETKSKGNTGTNEKEMRRPYYG